MLAAALIIAGVVTYILYEKSYLIIKPPPKPPPAPPPEIYYPKNKKELKILVDKAANLSGASCPSARGTTDRQKWMKCFNDSFEPAIRINGTKDTALVPAIIKVAVSTEYKVPPEVEGQNDSIKTGYRALMCSVRMVAISTLGKLQDPRAIKPLLKIMDESYDTQYLGCYFGRDESICRSAGEALLTFKPKGLQSRLIRNIEDHPYKTEAQIEKAISVKRESGTLTEDQAYRESGDSNIAKCNLDVLSKLGDEGKEAILEKLNDKLLSEPEQALYLSGLSAFPLDKRTLTLAKDYLNARDPGVRAEAAEALVGSATPENKDFYIWMFNNGFVKPACEAFGKLKSPELAPLLVSVIEKSDNGDTVTAAVKALKEFPAEAIKPIVPTLVNKIKTRDYARKRLYYELLMKAGDPSIVKDMMEIIYDPKHTNGSALDVIGRIPSVQSLAALQKIMTDKQFAKTVMGKNPEGPDERELAQRLNEIRYKALYWYLYIKGPPGKDYADKYFDPKIVDLELIIVKRDALKELKESKGAAGKPTETKPAGQK